MHSSEFFASVRQEPGAFIEPVDPMALHPFIVGYTTVNMALWEPLREVEARFDGPSAADACLRSCLHLTPAEAVDRVLCELIAVLEQRRCVSFEEGPDARKPLIDPIVQAAKEGRAAIYIGEPSILALANFTRGFLAAQAAWIPDCASVQENEIARFEAHLQKLFGHPGARWYRILRTYSGGGTGEYSLKVFVKHWEEWRESFRYERT
jgi:hypothetical protein